MNIDTVKEYESYYRVNNSISIPKDSNNRDYRKVQQWVASGGSLEQEDLLRKAKDDKVKEIKSIRDSKNVEPTSNSSVATAPLLKEGVYGLVLDGTKTVNFMFNMKPTGNSFTDPVSILTDIITGDVTTNYSTKKVSDDSNCYVRINKTIAENIRSHAKLRMLNNIYFCNKIEDAIEACTSITEVENINWDNFNL